MINLKQAALSYARMGLSIFPLRPRTKEPFISSWLSCRMSPASLEQVSEWWTKTPDANIALPTGSLNKIAVVDLDGPTGLNSASKIALNVDVRGEGGYVVAPGSVHPNGKLYRWMTNALGAVMLPKFPDLLPIVTSVTSGTAEMAKVVSGPVSWIADSLNNLSEGNRNDTFFRIAARLHRDGLKFADIMALLSPYAKETGFDRNELELCTRSATRYENSNASSLVLPTRVRTWENSKDEYESSKVRNRVVEFETGFKALTALTNGYQRKEVTIVAARTGVGKTNFIAATAKFLGGTHSVLIFSTETPFYRLYDRIGLDTIRRGNISVCDDSMPTLSDVRASVESSKADVVIFDHINHVSEDYETLSKYIHGLKQIATQYDIPVVVTAQLSRQADQKDLRTGKRVEVGMHMIKGSGTIEQIAAHVLLITEVGRDDKQIDLEASVVKNRYGECGKFYLRLLRNPWRLEEVI